MAIQMKLAKENNYLGFDFENAYWVVEYAGLKVFEDKVPLYSFKFTAYASKRAHELMIEGVMPTPLKDSNGVEFGWSEGDPNKELYSWIYVGPAQEIFPTSIPLDPMEQIHVCYEFVKQKLGLTNYVDVFE